MTTSYSVFRDGDRVGSINDPILAMRIDGLTVHNTAVEPHGTYEYEVIEDGGQ